MKIVILSKLAPRWLSIGDTSRIAVLVFLFTTLFPAIFAQDLTQLSEQINLGSVEQKRDALGKVRNLRSDASSRLALAALVDSDELVRATAINAIIYLPEPEVAAALTPLLSDRSEFIRREAAYALGEARSASAVSSLCRSVLSDRAAIVRSAAAAALGKIGNESAIASLATVLKRNPTSDNELLRRASARSIGQIAEMSRFARVSAATPESFLPEKYKTIASSSRTDAASAAFSAALAILLKVAGNRKETDDTRREAAFALGSIGDPSALPFLRANTGNADTYLAEICREALLKISR
ncbi:MAG: HEAT repeat domain-containing protein [Acidobacteriota bacterium]